MSEWPWEIAEENWEYVPALDPDGYSEKEIDNAINKHFGNDSEKDLTKTIKSGTIVNVPEIAGEIKKEKEMSDAVEVQVEVEAPAKPVKVRKLRAGQVVEVTPFGRRGRPSAEMLARRQAEVAAGYTLPVKAVGNGKRGRPQMFVRITVAEHAALIEAAAEVKSLRKALKAAQA